MTLPHTCGRCGKDSSSFVSVDNRPRLVLVPETSRDGATEPGTEPVWVCIGCAVELYGKSK